MNKSTDKKINHKKNISKYSDDYLAKLFQYTLGEDIANAVSHTFGVFFGLYALINLTWVSAKYGDLVDSFAFIFYGLTIFFMFLMSTLYHSMINPTARTVFKKLDHIAIYILILGSYTPFVFSVLKTDLSYLVYCILASCTVLGIVFKSLHAGKFKKLSTLIYIVMGWVALALLPQMSKIMPLNGLYFLLAGGIAYTSGAILYAVGKFKYLHAIWHIFVLLGVIFHYIAIAFFILPHKF